MWFWRYLLETYWDFLRLVYLWQIFPEELWLMLTDAFLFDRQLLRQYYRAAVDYQWLKREHGGYAAPSPFPPLASGPK